MPCNLRHLNLNSVSKASGAQVLKRHEVFALENAELIVDGLPRKQCCGGRFLTLTRS